MRDIDSPCAISSLRKSQLGPVSGSRLWTSIKFLAPATKSWFFWPQTLGGCRFSSSLTALPELIRVTREVDHPPTANILRIFGSNGLTPSKQSWPKTGPQRRLTSTPSRFQERDRVSGQNGA